MSRFFAVSLTVVLLAGTLGAGSAVAQPFGHFHGGYCNVLFSGASKGAEGVLFAGFLNRQASGTRYFAIATCEVRDENGFLVRSVKCKFSRGFVEGDSLSIGIRNMKVKSGNIVAREISNLALMARESFVGGADMKLTKSARFAWEVDYVWAIGEYDARVLRTATTTAEREAIVARLAAERLGRGRPRE